MKVFLWCVTNLLLLNCCTGNDITLEYHMKILLQGIEASENYQLPKDNSEFARGIYSNTSHDFGTYDFIIIGAGSAGSVLATRLSEIDNWNILLLEAGGEENDFNRMPLAYNYLQFSEKNWGYYTTPQQHSCLIVKDRQCFLPQGKSIGGSSAINGEVYTRGNSKDYDRWVDLGNKGWSYKEVLPYFKKSENSQIDGDYGYHGKGGFWNVEYTELPETLFQNFVDGNAELNVPFVRDYNGRNQIGVSIPQSNLKRAQRESTGTAFLDNARKRKNLKVVAGAFVTKININPENKRAQSVVFATTSKKFIARANKEIIVSAGAANSPRLLMLSGIGPKNHLEEMGIDVVANLPVGENLIDHVSFLGLVFRTNLTIPSGNLTQSVSQYLNGITPSPFAGLSVVGADKTPESMPVIEYNCNLAGGNKQNLKKVLNTEDRGINEYLDGLDPATDIVIRPILLHEKSRGRVTLKSSDPIDFPNVDPNYFSAPDDIEELIKSVYFIIELSQTEAFRKINATLLDIPICLDYEKNSKEFWKCVIQKTGTAGYHLCGSNAMGQNKSSSVVDNKLRVHGVENLRVVDASVFPSSLSAHTSAPAVMVAEKAADIIKAEYGIRVF